MGLGMGELLLILAIVLLIYRNLHSSDLDDVDVLKG